MSRSSPVPPALLEKQQELAVLTRLKAAVLALEERASRLAEGGDAMADGGDAIASVLSNWSQIFRIVHDAAPKDVGLASSSAGLRDPLAPGASDGANIDHLADLASDEAEAVPTLVRLEVATVSGSS